MLPATREDRRRQLKTPNFQHLWEDLDDLELWRKHHVGE